jgi:uncharacterized protein
MTPTGHPAPAWFDISSPDAPRARRFYQEIFGWPVNLLDETYALVSGEGGQPAGGIGQGWSRQSLHRAGRLFRADDIDDALARAEALGGTRVMEPAETPVSRIAAFAEPDGNLVGLLSR